MSAREPGSEAGPGDTVVVASGDGILAHAAAREPQRFGTIVVVGGGCYGSYYVRQLGRARRAGALHWQRLVVVDRDPGCRVAIEPQFDALEVVVRAWDEFFATYLADAVAHAESSALDAIVPSPLMPHLLFDWLVTSSRMRYAPRRVHVRPLATDPAVPWQRRSPNGETHYVSFAEWMCPINCIEPERCPHTRGERTWSLPPAMARYVMAEREAGRPMDGPFIFHCAHRAYGVGMIDVRDVLAADRAIAARDGSVGELAFLVGTTSHCHGALRRIVVR